MVLRRCASPWRRSGRGRGEPRIDIYWGSAADFLKELRSQLEKTKDEEVSMSSTVVSGGWF